MDRHELVGIAGETIGTAVVIVGIARATGAAGWSPLSAIDAEQLLVLALDALELLKCGQLADGLRRALRENTDDIDAEVVASALRLRAALEVVAARLRRSELSSSLTQVDAALDDCTDALDLLDDAAYREAVGETLIVEDTWWGRRSVVMATLPAGRFDRILETIVGSPRAKPTNPKVNTLKREAREIRFPTGSLEDVSLEGLESVLERSFPPGLAPERRAIARMVAADRVFGAFQGDEPVAVVHARVIPPHSSLGATDIEYNDGRRLTADLFPSLAAGEHFVVCHAAATLPEHRNARLAQRLITEVVLPGLAADPATRDLPWYTSSPLTHLVSTGRAIAQTPALVELIRCGDETIDILRPGGWRSIGKIIEAAWPWLARHGLCADRLDVGHAAAVPAEFFSSLYHALPTHAELVELRRSDAEGGTDGERQTARTMASRIVHLYQGPVSPILRNAHAASFVLVFLAGAFTQAGLHGQNGRPLDPILAFHLGNGARLASDVGPMPNSRREDIAALRFGQVLEYRKDWRAEQASNRELFARRSAQSSDAVQLDRDFARSYFARCFKRTLEFVRSALNVTPPSAARLGSDGIVTTSWPRIP
jgi:hypothetical protein